VADKTTLRAGKLRDRIRLERSVVGVDGAGRRTGTTWIPVATVWANVEPLSARDAIVAAETAAKVIAKIWIRYRPGVDATMRAVHIRKDGNVLYAITGVLTDRESGVEYLVLPVSAGTNRG
jgi:SPP1 family predicted phage head-tail adaptor